MQYNPIIFSSAELDNWRLPADNRTKIREFLKACNTQDKAEYLEWVVAWKLQTKLLEDHIRYLKTRRKGPDKHDNAVWMKVVYRGLATEMYEARIENKKLSWANRNATKEVAA